MGSPLSPVLANLFMIYFEKKIIDTFSLKPKIWLRYMDDIFVIWSYGIDELNNFLSHMNSLHPNIDFTIELENNQSLPFLDVLVQKNLDGSISHSDMRASVESLLSQTSIQALTLCSIQPLDVEQLNTITNCRIASSTLSRPAALRRASA